MLAARHRARLAMADENPDSREAKLKNVRRRLNFGDTKDDNLPTRKELERQFKEERSQHLEEKKTKWNFDFKEERPLAGQWQWERVEESSDKCIKGRTAAPENTDANTDKARGHAQDQAP